MIYQTLLAAAIVGSASAKIFPADESAQRYLWNAFKAEHGKTYTGDEEATRFGHFLANLKQADIRQQEEIAAGGSAQHGITKFSDMSQAEFEGFLMAKKPDTPSTAEVMYNVPASDKSGLVDWSGKLTTPVKDQGYCGSCWAFSATEQIESDAMRTLSSSYILSPQQITSCDTTSYGCNGGWTEHAYNYVSREGGLEQDSDYPYTSYNGKTGTCKASSSKEVISVSKYTTINGETNMGNYVKSTGPLSVCVDANSWNSYTGGIMSSCGKSVDHCVQAVGVDTSSYWKVRNSWGTSWGESGYIRLKYGQNTCAITSDPTWVTVSKK